MSAVKASTKKSGSKATVAETDKALAATEQAALDAAKRATGKVSDPLVVHACARSKFEHTKFGPDGNMPAEAVAEYDAATDVLIRTKSHSAAGIAYKIANAMELAGGFESSTPSPDEIFNTIAEGPTDTRLLASAYLDAMTQGHVPVERADVWHSALTAFKKADAAYYAAGRAYDTSFTAVRDNRPEAPDLAREYKNGKPGAVIRLNAVDNHVRDMPPAMAEQVRAAVEAHWAAVEALEEEHRFYELEEEQEAATEARWKALGEVIDTPAPDVSALAEKMRLHILDSAGVDVADQGQVQRFLSQDEKVEARQMLAIYRDTLSIAGLPDPTAGIAAFNPKAWLVEFEASNASPFWFDDRGCLTTDEHGSYGQLPTSWKALPDWKKDQVKGVVCERGSAWRVAADIIDTYDGGWWTLDEVDAAMKVRWPDCDGAEFQLAWEYIDLSGFTVGDGEKNTGARRAPFDAAHVAAALARLPVLVESSPDGKVKFSARAYQLNKLLRLIQSSWSEDDRAAVAGFVQPAKVESPAYLHAAE